MTAADPSQTPQPAGAADRPSGDIGEAFQLVKAYAKQETLGPLRGAGRWLGFGIAGSVMLAIAGLMLVLGVLRLLQTEVSDFRDGWLNLVPYAVALLVALGIVVFAVTRISKSPLNKD